MDDLEEILFKGLKRPKNEIPDQAQEAIKKYNDWIERMYPDGKKLSTSHLIKGVPEKKYIDSHSGKIIYKEIPYYGDPRYFKKKKLPNGKFGREYIDAKHATDKGFGAVPYDNSRLYSKEMIEAINWYNDKSEKGNPMTRRQKRYDVTHRAPGKNAILTKPEPKWFKRPQYYDVIGIDAPSEDLRYKRGYAPVIIGKGRLGKSGQRRIVYVPEKSSIGRGKAFGKRYSSKQHAAGQLLQRKYPYQNFSRVSNGRFEKYNPSGASKSVSKKAPKRSSKRSSKRSASKRSSKAPKRSSKRSASKRASSSISKLYSRRK